MIDGRDILPLFTGDAKSPHEVIFGQQGRQTRDRARRPVEAASCSRRASGWPASYKPGDHWIDPRAPDGVTILAPYEQAQPGEHPGLLTGDAPKPMQLFDLPADPGEQHDVAAQHPGEVRRLAALGVTANAEFESASAAQTKKRN